jgi:hypothetical protein
LLHDVPQELALRQAVCSHTIILPIRSALPA